MFEGPPLRFLARFKEAGQPYVKLVDGIISHMNYTIVSLNVFNLNIVLKL